MVVFVPVSLWRCGLLDFEADVEDESMTSWATNPILVVNAMETEGVVLSVKFLDQGFSREDHQPLDVPSNIRRDDPYLYLNVHNLFLVVCG